MCWKERTDCLNLSSDPHMCTQIGMPPAPPSYTNKIEENGISFYLNYACATNLLYNMVIRTLSFGVRAEI